MQMSSDCYYVVAIIKITLVKDSDKSDVTFFVLKIIVKKVLKEKDCRKVE